MHKKFFYLVGLTTLLVLSACSDEIDYTDLQEAEGRYFDLYIQANYPEVEPTESGLYYVEYEEGTGASPDSGDWVLINYLAYTIPDENVVDTYNEEWAQEHDLYTTGVLYGPYKYMHGGEIAGMREGLSMMKEGGIARLLFKSDLGYGEESVGQIGKFESLMYDIELVEVIDDVLAWEQAKIDSFLSDYPRAFVIRDTADGETVEMYYIPTQSGEGDQVVVGSEVEVYYTGTLLDGREFDSNVGNSSGYSLTVGDGDVIRGWDLGLKYLRYGGTGQLLIPHQFAYGADGKKVNNTNKVSIPPYEALLFDIEIVLPEEEEVE